MGIEQLIVSYWWIILLVAVVFFLLLRSLIKFLITVSILSVIIFLFWTVFLSSGFSELNQCLTDQTNRGKDVYEKALQLGPGTEQNQMICSSDVISFSRLTDCLDESRQKNGFSFQIFTGLSKYKTAIDEIISAHNKLCPDSPLSPPSFSDQ